MKHVIHKQKNTIAHLSNFYKMDVLMSPAPDEETTFLALLKIPLVTFFLAIISWGNYYPHFKIAQSRFF